LAALGLLLSTLLCAALLLLSTLCPSSTPLMAALWVLICSLLCTGPG
jgi:hypothetical protein